MSTPVPPPPITNLNRSQTRPQSLQRHLALGALFGFLVILALALIGDLRRVSARMLAFHWGYFPLVLALTLFNYTLRFFKWHFYLGQIGVEGLSLGESARLFVAGFPLAVTPGKVGEALKGVWLNRAVDIPVGRGISVVLAERISDGLAVLALSTLGVVAYPNYWPAFTAVLVLLLSVVVVSQIRPLALRLLDIGQRLPVVGRFAHSMGEFYEGSYALFRPRASLIAVSLGTAAWLGEGIGLYLVLQGLGVPSGWETLSIAVFTLSFSTVIGAVSALPGGLGAADASISGMLVLLLGLSVDTAAAATLLIRFATLWFGVSLGLIVWAATHNLPIQAEPAPEAY